MMPRTSSASTRIERPAASYHRRRGLLSVTATTDAGRRHEFFQPETWGEVIVRARTIADSNADRTRAGRVVGARHRTGLKKSAKGSGSDPARLAVFRFAREMLGGSLDRCNAAGANPITAVTSDIGRKSPTRNDRRRRGSESHLDVQSPIVRLTPKPRPATPPDYDCEVGLHPVKFQFARQRPVGSLGRLHLRNSYYASS